MENFLSRQIPHDFVEDVDEVLSRLILLTGTLELSLRLPECCAKRLNLVPFLSVQTKCPRW